LEETVADQKPNSNTAMNKSQEGVAGRAPTAATTPPTVSHSNEIQKQTPDDKQDSSSTSTESPGSGAGKQAGSSSGRR